MGKMVAGGFGGGNMKLPNGWKVDYFSKVLSIIKDGTHFSPKEFGGTNKYITSKNIGFGYLVTRDIRFISDKEHQRIYSGSPVKYGDVLFTKDGANTGNAAINSFEEPISLLSSVAFLRGAEDIVDNNYLCQWLLSDMVQKEIYKQLTGQAITRITLEKLGKFKIWYPNISEQRAIVELLSTWDTAIEKTEQLIMAKENGLQWLLNEFIIKRGKKEKWKKIKLGNSGQIYTGLTGKAASDFGEGKPFITYLNVYQNPFVNPKQLGFVKIDKNEKQNLVKKGDVLFTTSSETPDEVGISSVVLRDIGECYLNSFCFGWRPQNDLFISEYLSCYFRSSLFRKQMLILAQGSTRFNVSKSEVMKATILVPNLETQCKIAEILFTAQKEIVIYRRVMESQNQQKRGLMQKLLTGAWRVKVDAN
jgi:type I restriction enzyme S subunit